MIGAADQRAAGAGAAPPQALSPEAKTHLQKRPTCVSVIGWAWIIIGVNLFLSCVLGLSAWLMIGAMSETELDRPFFRILPLICVLLLAMAVSGLVAGVHFLRLKAWARTVLEVLTWLFLVYTTAFIVFWLIGWFAATSGYGPRDPGEIIGAVIGVIIAAGYGVPFIIMLKYLRGDTVRNAIAGGRDPVGSPICQ